LKEKARATGLVVAVVFVVEKSLERSVNVDGVKLLVDHSVY
jgi:hypothetical protein